MFVCNINFLKAAVFVAPWSQTATMWKPAYFMYVFFYTFY